MNDFTKDELLTLREGIEHLPNNVNLNNQYMFNCGVLLHKLNDLIDNYCEHEWNFDTLIKKIALNPGESFPVECKKCGNPYKS